MEKEIELQNRKIKYFQKYSKRSKRIRLAIYPGGKIVLTSPSNVADGFVNNFMIKKAQWIITKYDNLKLLSPKTANPEEYNNYKQKASDLAHSRLEYFNQTYGFKYNKVSIKNHTTLWGSCSKKGNLNFNYKIALLSPRQSDYIIVHELCHLKEFNHSKRFWDLVAQTIPDYKQIRLELKGKSLT
jgi:predicted metal-dependent hydrolase